MDKSCLLFSLVDMRSMDRTYMYSSIQYRFYRLHLKKLKDFPRRFRKLTRQKLIRCCILVGKYFQRAVIQSGSALSPWAVSYDAHSCAQWLARNVNCSSFTNDIEGLTKCLRSRSAQDLVNSSPAAPKYHSCMAPSPNPYGEIFRAPVENLMKESRNTFTSIPVIFGVTSSEAYMYLKQKEQTDGISEQRKSQIIRTFVLNNFQYNRQKIYDILYHQYTSWDTVQTEFTRRDNILQLLSDGLYVAPLVKMAQQHSLSTDTYLYAFTHATVSDTAQYHNWTSAVHGDELAYIFGAPLVEGVTPFSDKFTPQEKVISQTMMRYWTNFAKTGYLLMINLYLLFVKFYLMQQFFSLTISVRK